MSRAITRCWRCIRLASLAVAVSWVMNSYADSLSMLYAAAWRAVKALGFRRLVTYTQAGESGSSLRAAGWRVVAERPPRKGWDTPSRPRESRGTEHVQRFLWEAA